MGVGPVRANREIGAMEISSAFQVWPSEGEKPGAYASFPYDRDLVRRFREAFPRARWRGAEERWFVPGTTAAHRLDVWMSQELETLDRHADAKGRDAFLFDPMESAYLTVGDDLQVRTPYSRTIVEAMRTIPWAWWDSASRVWRVPFRSYEVLRRRWPDIEEAARRNEPEARRTRRDERRARGSGPAERLQAERRRRRYPVPGDDLPPLEQPVSTFTWGVVVFEEIESERIGQDAPVDVYPHVPEQADDYVWARWRVPWLQEVYRAKPAPDGEGADLKARRGWWPPTRDELRERARRLRETERAQRSREAARKPSADA
jgi:hypothetical protein